MRLQREAKIAKKQYADQMKKTGKLEENFICLPDPENMYEWYYIIYNIEGKEGVYQGGYYMGAIKCPDVYPAKAPNIRLITENGRFRLQQDGICLSISDMHPESWNPAWRVSQIVTGLQQFWVGSESTYGDVYNNEWGYTDLLTLKDRRIQFAMESREAVLKHEKFQAIFGEYADAIGINEKKTFEHWEPMVEKLANFEKVKAERVLKTKEDEELRKKKAREDEEARLLVRQKADAEKQLVEQKKMV